MPHGVGPPAQLGMVPESATNSPRLRPATVGLDHGASAGVDGARVVHRALDVRHAELRAGVELVVLDQGVAAVAGVVDGHAVVVGRGHALATVEPGHAGPGDHCVAEALGQGQDSLRVVHERREGHVTGLDRRVRPGRAGLGQRRQAAGDGKANAGGGAASEEGTTRGRHGDQLLVRTSATTGSQLLRANTETSPTGSLGDIGVKNRGRCLRGPRFAVDGGTRRPWRDLRSRACRTSVAASLATGRRTLGCSARRRTTGGRDGRRWRATPGSRARGPSGRRRCRPSGAPRRRPGAAR